MSNSRPTQITINDSYWQEITSFFNQSYLPDYFIALVMANYNLGGQQKQHIGISLALLEFVQHVVNNNKHFIQNIYLPFLYRNNIQYLYRQVGFLPLGRWLESQSYTYESVFEILNHPETYQLTRRAADLDTLSHGVFTQSNTTKPSKPSWVGFILTAGVLLFSVITAKLFPKTGNKIGTNYYLKWLLTKLFLQICLLNRNYQEQKQPSKAPLLKLQEQAEMLDLVSTQYLTLIDETQSNDVAELNTSVGALIARKIQENRNNDAGIGEAKQMLKAQIHSFDDLIHSVEQRDDKELLRYVCELKGLLEELNEPSPHQRLSLCIAQIFIIEQQFVNDEISLEAIDVLTEHIEHLSNVVDNTDQLIRIENNYRGKTMHLNNLR